MEGKKTKFDSFGTEKGSFPIHSHNDDTYMHMAHLTLEASVQGSFHTNIWWKVAGHLS